MDSRHSHTIEQLRGGLIVSCQALEGEPLYGAHFMAAMARAAHMGGAVGIRANTAVDIRAIKEAVPLPVIGLFKHTYPNSDVYITPTLADVRMVADAGAELVATDATRRPRPDGQTLAELFRQIHVATGVLIVADVSTFEEGLAAEAAGADLISTTMSGYTSYSRQAASADIELVGRLAHTLSLPVLAEGRIWTPEEARAALDAGAYAVVVGSAITRPQTVVRRFAQALGHRTGQERASS